MPLSQLLDRLAAVEPTEMPFISLYVDTRPDGHGRDHFEATIRKELHARAATYPQHSGERESFDRDVERIMRYLKEELQPASHCVAIFARGGEGDDDVFEAVQLDKPIDGHDLHVGRLPHLYPLARLGDQYRRYAVVLADTNSARLFVFGSESGAETVRVSGVKMTHSSGGAGRRHATSATWRTSTCTTRRKWWRPWTGWCAPRVSSGSCSRGTR